FFGRSFGFELLCDLADTGDQRVAFTSPVRIQIGDFHHGGTSLSRERGRRNYRAAGAAHQVPVGGSNASETRRTSGNDASNRHARSAIPWFAMTTATSASRRTCFSASSPIRILSGTGTAPRRIVPRVSTNLRSFVNIKPTRS